MADIEPGYFVKRARSQSGYHGDSPSQPALTHEGAIAYAQYLNQQAPSEIPWTPALIREDVKYVTGFDVPSSDAILS